MKTVHLHGSLQKEFGDSFEVNQRSPQMAIRFLCDVLPREFENAIRSGTFHLVRGDLNYDNPDNVEYNELNMGFGANDLHLIPAVEGSGSGVFSAILGVVLIVVGAVVDVYTGGTGGNTFIVAGIGMVAGGVAGMLSPAATGTNYANQDAPDSRASFLFNGAVNTQAQGGPVPLIYGRFQVGSTVISAGLDVAQLLS